LSARHTGSALLLVLCTAVCARAPTLPMQSPDDTILTVSERSLSIDDIKNELWDEGNTRIFRPSTLMERLVIPDILASLLSRADTGDADLGRLAAKAARIGFQIEVWRVDGGLYWALLEQNSQRRGAGAYIVRISKRSQSRIQMILQTPHAYYDVGTGIIGARLFFGGEVDARALFTNTVHRYWDATGDYQPREGSASDVCHRLDHVFQYATDTAARVLGDVVVVQLHGFADSPKRPDAITSAGDANGSTPLVMTLQQKIGDLLGDTKRFPEETEELGGTTNVQGHLLSNYRHAYFVHVELSKNIRERLLDSAEMLARFGSVLVWDIPDRQSPGGTSR
jgi:hypothetical protein